MNSLPVNSGMITRRDEDEDDRERAEHDEDQPEQRAGELERLLALAVLLQQLGEDRDERGAERRVGEQRAHQVRDLEGDRERRDGAAVPK